MSDPATGDRFEIHLKIDQPECRVIDWLSDGCPLGRGQLKEAMHKGAVWLTRGGGTQRIRRAKRVLTTGDELHLYYDPKVLNQEPPIAERVADEGGYSVWYKPSGMLCQGSKYGDHCTLPRWVQQQLLPERPSFLVHRLDRATQGLILLAHSKASVRALTALFESRQVDKRYLAVARGELRLSDELIDRPVNGKAARSRVTTRSVDPVQGVSLVEVALETGRKHQIRQHLASLNCPLLGDRLYGAGEADGCDLQLQAVSLAFVCPLTGEQRSYQLPESRQLTLPSRA